MSLALHMDVHIPLPLTLGLRDKGVDILTAQEDGARLLADPKLLDRATVLNRVLVTFDRDFLEEAAERQVMGKAFAGVIIIVGIGVDFAICLADLELIAKVYEARDIFNCVEYLPL